MAEDKPLDPEQVQRAILALVQLAGEWTDARSKPNYRLEVRFHDEKLLRTVVDAVGQHQEDLPVGQHGKNIIHRSDIWRASARRKIARVLAKIRGGAISPEKAEEQLLGILDGAPFVTTQADLREAVAFLAGRQEPVILDQSVLAQIAKRTLKGIPSALLSRLGDKRSPRATEHGATLLTEYAVATHGNLELWLSLRGVIGSPTSAVRYLLRAAGYTDDQIQDVWSRLRGPKPDTAMTRAAALRRSGDPRALEGEES